MLLGDIIKDYRSKHNLSMQNFADLIHSSKSYVSMLEKNYNPATGKPISPSLETLKLISVAIHIDIDTLLKMLDGEQEIILSEDKFKEQFKSPYRIPVLGRIPAGVPLEMIEDILDYEELADDMLRGGKEYFALKVSGDSMYPEYLNGDVLIVLKQNDCESGQDCVVAVNGDDATFKRVYKLNGGITLQPLNNQYVPVFYSNEDILNKPVKILGIVKQIRRDK